MTERKYTQMGHMSISTSYLEDRIRELKADGKPQKLLSRTGADEYPTHDEALADLANLRLAGQEWITSPECDNVRPDGHCGGHTIKE